MIFYRNRLILYITGSIITIYPLYSKNMTYQIKSGDNLTRIAEKFNINIDEFKTFKSY